MSANLALAGDTTQRINLEVVAPAPRLGGLDTSINKLRALEAAIFSVQVRYDALIARFRTASVPTIQVPRAPVMPRSPLGSTPISGTRPAYAPPASMIRPAMVPSGSPRLGVQGRDLLEATGHVTNWAASAAVLYGSLRMARGAMENLIQTGWQQARLTQVFRGQAGEVSKLTDEILKLAAANGRSSSEAMESGIQWARFGLQRTQVAEAVRVSLIAANVAELSAGEATERLSGIMAGYKLKVSELSGALGMLNQISNTWNVTNKDMLDGLARVAPIARQAGLSFAETIGIIGATKGATGQTGPNIGNAMKSVIGSLASPKIQNFLRNEFKLELSVAGTGEVKNMSEVLQELYVTYQKLTDTERQHLVYQIGGKTQAARLAAILDSYVKAQTLAISAQLNLNSAEKENDQILKSLKAQLTGLISEWNRFVNVQGNRGPVEALGQITQAFHNVLRLMNTSGGSAVATGLLAVLTAMGAKLAITMTGMSAAAGAGNFLSRSWLSVKGAALNMSNAMMIAVQQFAAVNRTIGPATAALEGWGRGAIIYGRATGGVLGAGFRVAGASARVLAVAIAGLVQAAIPLLVIGAGIEIFNLVMNRSARAAEEAERKMAGFASEAERANKAASGIADAMRLLDTVSRSLPNARPEARARMIGDVSGVAYYTASGSPDAARNHALKQQLDTLVSQNKIAEAQKVLEGARNELSIRRMALLGQELAAMDEQRKSVLDQIEALETKNRKSGETPKRTKELQEAQTRLAELNSQKVQKIVEGSADNSHDLEARLAADVKHVAFLEREKLIAESLREIYSEISGPGHLDKLNAEITAFSRTIEHNKQVIGKLQADPEVAAKEAKEREDAITRNLNEQAKARAELKRIDSEIAKTGATGPSDITPDYVQNLLDFRKSKMEMHHGIGGMTGGFLDVIENVSDAIKGGGGEKFKALADLLGQKSSATDYLLGLTREKTSIETAPALRGGPTEINQKRIDLISEQNDKLEAELRARAAEGPRTLAEFRDTASYAGGFARNLLTGAAVGEDEAQRLLAQQRAAEILASQQMRLAALENNRADANYRILFAVNALNSAQDLAIQKEQMRAKLSADILNIEKESRREFERGLLTSGPGDLLRKMAAAQLTRGGMTSGAFFSLSEGARGDWLQMTGGTRLADAKRQLGELGGAGAGDLAELKKQMGQILNWTRQRAQLMEKLNINPRAEGNVEITASAKAAAGNLNLLTTAANDLRMAFCQFKSEIAEWLPGNNFQAPANAQAHKNN